MRMNLKFRLFIIALTKVWKIIIYVVRNIVCNWYLFQFFTVVELC